MKYTIYLLILLFLGSCGEKNSDSLFLKQRISYLEEVNDSLVNLVNQVNQKYVFDSISILSLPIKKDKRYKKGDVFNGEYYIVAYNKDLNPFMSFDGRDENDKKVNLNYLQREKGTFKISKMLERGENFIFIDFGLNSNLGIKEEFLIMDLINAE